MTHRARIHLPLFLALLFVATVSLPSVLEARARERHQLSPKQRAKRFFKKGKKLYKKEKFVEAVQMFQKAFAILPHRNILLNIAICYAELERPYEAMRHLRRALRMSRRKAEDVLDKKEYRKLLDMQKKVAVLEVRAPDRRAVIYLDGESCSGPRLDRVLTPGKHAVSIDLDGKTVVSRTFVLKLGDHERWYIASWADAFKTGKKGGGAIGRLHVAWFGSAAALALATGLSSIGTAVVSKKHSDDYASTGDTGARDKRDTYRTATHALIGVSVTSAVAAIILGVFTDWKGRYRKPSGPSATLRPFTGPGSAGLVVTGRF